MCLQYQKYCFLPGFQNASRNFAVEALNIFVTKTTFKPLVTYAQNAAVVPEFGANPAVNEVDFDDDTASEKKVRLPGYTYWASGPCYFLIYSEDIYLDIGLSFRLYTINSEFPARTALRLKFFLFPVPKTFEKYIFEAVSMKMITTSADFIESFY
jgi:hypothetical protein